MKKLRSVVAEGVQNEQTRQKKEAEKKSRLVAEQGRRLLRQRQHEEQARERPDHSVVTVSTTDKNDTSQTEASEEFVLMNDGRAQKTFKPATSLPLRSDDAAAEAEVRNQKFAFNAVSMSLASGELQRQRGNTGAEVKRGGSPPALPSRTAHRSQSGFQPTMFRRGEVEGLGDDRAGGGGSGGNSASPKKNRQSLFGAAQRTSMKFVEAQFGGGGGGETTVCAADEIPGQQGHLYKLGEKHRSWKKRWFTVDVERGSLSYYLRSDEKTKKGTIDLLRVNALYPIPHGFEQNAKGMPEFCLDITGRTYVMYAETKEMTERWLVALQVIVCDVKSVLAPQLGISGSSPGGIPSSPPAPTLGITPPKPLPSLPTPASAPAPNLFHGATTMPLQKPRTGSYDRAPSETPPDSNDSNSDGGSSKALSRSQSLLSVKAMNVRLDPGDDERDDGGGAGATNDKRKAGSWITAGEVAPPRPSRPVSEIIGHDQVLPKPGLVAVKKTNGGGGGSWIGDRRKPTIQSPASGDPTPTSMTASNLTQPPPTRPPPKPPSSLAPATAPSSTPSASTSSPPFTSHPDLDPPSQSPSSSSSSFSASSSSTSSSLSQPPPPSSSPQPPPPSLSSSSSPPSSPSSSDPKLDAPPGDSRLTSNRSPRAGDAAAPTRDRFIVQQRQQRQQTLESQSQQE
eukprot:TRINITY_DN4342_c0_g3_i1.p1 TRINITY_DN4342_c0_g3~~TRINITY_DN4342_c0_g3_i1.p1  ORF type:complete len:680 (+),score=180.65 TRINITY_DN4342_c0_g3_i1:449-2488(+)